METRTINWQGLSNSQKTKLLKQTKAYLKQQASEAKFCKLITETYNIKA